MGRGPAAPALSEAEAQKPAHRAAASPSAVAGSSPLTAAGWKQMWQ